MGVCLLCFGSDVIEARQSRFCELACVSSVASTQTAMVSVSFSGNWFIFSCGTKLVAVHTKQSRFGQFYMSPSSFTVFAAVVELANSGQTERACFS